MLRVLRVLRVLQVRQRCRRQITPFDREALEVALRCQPDPRDDLTQVRHQQCGQTRQKQTRGIKVRGVEKLYGQEYEAAYARRPHGDGERRAIATEPRVHVLKCGGTARRG